jgi:hypothetical protein
VTQYDYYGIPVWLMKEYLSDLGATEVAENVMQGDAWQAQISKAKPNQIGSLVIGGATVQFSGDADALEALFKKLHMKTLRGGG